MFPDKSLFFDLISCLGEIQQAAEGHSKKQF